MEIAYYASFFAALAGIVLGSITNDKDERLKWILGAIAWGVLAIAASARMQ